VLVVPKGGVLATLNLEDFLKKLDDKHELLHIEREISLKYDVGKVLMKLYHTEKRPAVMFHKPGGKDIPLVANIFSTREKAAIALGTTVDKLNEKILSGMKNPVKPEVVTDAPCQEVTITGSDVDINKFPVPYYSPDDGGPYITPGIVVSKDPETGIPDFGHYRFQVIDKNVFSFLAQPFHRFGANIAKAKKMGVKIEAALVIGYDPALGYATQAKLGEVDDFSYAGGILGEPLKVVKCKTIDVQGPASSQVVFELEVNYDKMFKEGPLGEYTGYYTPPYEKPTATVKTITYTKEPIFQALLTGKPSPITENHILKEIPFEASLYGDLKSRFPSIKSVRIPPFGGVQACVIISMSPRFPGEAKQAVMYVLSSFVAPKYAIVVDEDINIFDMADVMWALSFRVRPERDIFTIEDTLRVPLDPSSKEGGVQTTKTAVGIDATIPVGIDYPKVADVPGWKEFNLPELDKMETGGS
jgi:2,5-furandicarboxylate decarboxylase 1